MPKKSVVQKTLVNLFVERGKDGHEEYTCIASALKDSEDMDEEFFFAKQRVRDEEKRAGAQPGRFVVEEREIEVADDSVPA